MTPMYTVSNTPYYTWYGQYAYVQRATRSTNGLPPQGVTTSHVTRHLLPFILIVIWKRLKEKNLSREMVADLKIGGAPGLLPVALQLPCAADPGTLTERLLRDTARALMSNRSKRMKSRPLLKMALIIHREPCLELYHPCRVVKGLNDGEDSTKMALVIYWEPCCPELSRPCWEMSNRSKRMKIWLLLKMALVFIEQPLSHPCWESTRRKIRLLLKMALVFIEKPCLDLSCPCRLVKLFRRNEDSTAPKDSTRYSLRSPVSNPVVNYLVKSFKKSEDSTAP